MTDLQRRALASLPLTTATVESFWNGTYSGTAEQCLKALCISHERLRAELEGADLLLREADPQVEWLLSRIAAALALTDTGNPEFHTTFPSESAGPALLPREYVPGWRVVEKIREVLLGG